MAARTSGTRRESSACLAGSQGPCETRRYIVVLPRGYYALVAGSKYMPHMRVSKHAVRMHAADAVEVALTHRESRSAGCDCRQTALRFRASERRAPKNMTSCSL